MYKPSLFQVKCHMLLITEHDVTDDEKYLSYDYEITDQSILLVEVEQPYCLYIKGVKLYTIHINPDEFDVSFIPY